MKTITEWLNNQNDYGLCNPPMDAQQALDFLAGYLDISCDNMPESKEQTNTYIVLAILDKYSKKFKRERKKCKNN